MLPACASFDDRCRLLRQPRRLDVINLAGAEQRYRGNANDAAWNEDLRRSRFARGRGKRAALHVRVIGQQDQAFALFRICNSHDGMRRFGVAP
jgi:hypothetical protein